MIQFNNLEDFKKYAKEKLQETDFAVLSDVQLKNKQEFVTYRGVIRLALITDSYNFQFQDAPIADWTPVEKTADQPQPETDIPTV
jgi:hypothetical protein